MTIESRFGITNDKLIFKENFEGEFWSRKIEKRGGSKMKFDLTGRRFGKLIALEINRKGNNGSLFWKCICDCGKETITKSSSLRSGKTKSCGCLRTYKIRQKLEGKKFGKLTIVDFAYKKHGNNFWNCLCDCGELTIKSTSALSQRRQCYKCGRKFSEKGRSGLTILIKQYKFDAKKRGYSWNLERDQVKQITSSPCVYCGKNPSNRINTNTTDNHGDYIYNGIDRLDNKIGYNNSNCVPCCTKCNWMKMDLDIMEFSNHIKNIYNNFIIKNDH